MAEPTSAATALAVGLDLQLSHIFRVVLMLFRC